MALESFAGPGGSGPAALDDARTLARARREDKGVAACGLQGPAKRLLDLALAVERIGRGRSANPETILIEKLTVAGAMRRLAAELGT
jgi:hypothetical protein